MRSSIDARFRRLREAGRLGLVAYVTAGDPDLLQTQDILCALDRSGVDLLEVGVPFSDPVADGPVIQQASARALAAGGSLTATLKLVETVRARLHVPLVLFSYANPIFRMGIEQFAERAANAGFDGVLTVDLPVEEMGELAHALKSKNLESVLLVSPTTRTARIQRAAALAGGFWYCISRLGVTGTRETLDHGIETLVSRVRAVSDLPIAVGFGLSRPDHLRSVARWADAAVVGSALVEVIGQSGEAAERVGRVERYVSWLREGIENEIRARSSS